MTHGRSLRRWPLARLPAALALGLALAPSLARAGDPACADCHGEAAELAPGHAHAWAGCGDCHAGTDRVPHVGQPAAVDCAACHADVFEALAASVHGEAENREPLGAADCAPCHGPPHAMLPRADPGASVHPDRLAGTCAGCHSDPAMAERFRLRAAHPVEVYAASVHGRAVAEGRPGATCADCHGAHDILPAPDTESPVNHWRVSQTCGACHASVARSYRDSVHGEALARGVRQAPACTDCHGEHDILSPDEEDSRVFARNIPSQTCGPCHDNVRVTAKFGMDAERIPTFEDSFHGLALRAGAVTVAHCGSCHGVHDVRPSSDPRSSIHPDNLPTTCGGCHPGAGRSFAIGTVHVVENQSEHPAVRVVRLAYLWLIAIVIGAMVLHNGLDFARKLGGPTRAPTPQREKGRERMSRGFRAVHGVLIVSFSLLVWSGFALSYPDAWWASPLALGGDPAALRAGVHRAAALTLLAALLAHAVHLVRDRGARACIAAMRPRRRDWLDLREHMAWALHRRSEPPHSAWVSYPEKVEYVALLWGVAIMAVTGLALWANDWTLRWLPKWVMDLADTIHFYEGVLASLAILVWHFYFVIFDPAVYPMDKAWITGRSHSARDEERDDPPGVA